MPSPREELEAALIAEPDDGAAHAAYADCLMEEGDPRGEYIRLLLALENRDQPASDLDAIHKHIRRLESLHKWDWYNSIFARDSIELTLRRSWVESLAVENLDQAILDAITTLPTCRLIRELTVLTVAVDLRTVEAAEQLADFLRTTPIDSLSLSNWSLGHAGLKALVQPKMPPRLKRVTLRACALTDDDADTLADAAKQLDHLDLAGNLFSPIGAASFDGMTHVHIGEQRYVPSTFDSIDIQY